MENQTQTTNEEVDTSTFMNNNPVLVGADLLWSKVFSPVINFFERLQEKLTGKWVQEQLALQAEEEESQNLLLLEAEQYRKDQESQSLKDLSRPL